jgi:hypothetical protein
MSADTQGDGMGVIAHDHRWRPVGMIDPPDHHECAVPGCDATTVEAMVYVPEAAYRGAVAVLRAIERVLDSEVDNPGAFRLIHGLIDGGLRDAAGGQ